MLRVDYGRWGQTPADLRQLALSALHPRSRERFLALHDIAQGSCATEVAERTDRRPHTVMDWLHTYNEHGPEALMYRRTGGRPPCMGLLMSSAFQFSLYILPIPMFDRRDHPSVL